MPLADLGVLCALSGEIGSFGCLETFLCYDRRNPSKAPPSQRDWVQTLWKKLKAPVSKILMEVVVFSLILPDQKLKRKKRKPTEANFLQPAANNGRGGGDIVTAPLEAAAIHRGDGGVGRGVLEFALGRTTLEPCRPGCRCANSQRIPVMD